MASEDINHEPSTLNAAKPIRRKRPRRLVWKVLFSVMFTLILLELALRVQQKLGPWIDLEMPSIHAGIISEELNHRPEKVAHWPYDENGLMQYSEELLPGSVKANPKALRILFMGDSFMQGLGGKEEIPWQVWSHYQASGISMIPFNAGCYSYSPSIFIVQAKKLLPLVKPDAVVMIIDNTDMGDDAYRYREFVVRDAQGKIIAVKSNPGYAFFIRGFLDIKQHSLYLTKLIHKYYHTRFAHPQFDQGKTFRISEWIEDSITCQDPDVAQKYGAELKLFEANLRELADVLIENLGTGQKVMWVCHPNPFHLKTPEGQKAPNQLVFDTVERVAREKGIHYYNSTNDMRRDLGADFSKYYLKGDPVYHFTPEGSRIYARHIFENIPADWKSPKK